VRAGLGARFVYAWRVEASDAYEAIAGTLVRDGFETAHIDLGDTDVLAARRSRWASTAKIHEFVLVFRTARLSGEEAERLANAAQRYVIKHKGGLPRGLQTGTATIAVFLDEDPQSSAVQWVDQSPIHRFAALRFAVLLNTATHEFVYWRGQWTRGGAFRQVILDLVQGVILGPVRGVVGDGDLQLRELRAPGSDEEKLAHAVSAARTTMRRTYVVMTPLVVVPVAAALYLAEGLGGAVFGAVLSAASIGFAAWTSLRR